MILFVKILRKSCLYKYIVLLNQGNLLQQRRKKPLTSRLVGSTLEEKERAVGYNWGLKKRS
jgi:hypothetical protein